MVALLRYPGLQAKFGGVSKDFIEANLVLKDEADPFVPGTNETIRRLRRIYLGPQTPAFDESDADALAAALIEHGKKLPLPPMKPGGAVDAKFHSSVHRKRARKRVKKSRRAA
jgi:hypothetical protein